MVEIMIEFVSSQMDNLKSIIYQPARPKETFHFIIANNIDLN